MKLLALADVHLGAHPQFSNDRLGEQEQVLAAAAQLAIDHQVDVVLFAGDMFHGPTVKSSLYRRVQRSFADALDAAGIPVVAISGNGSHDQAASEGEDNALAVLHRQDRFDVVTRPKVIDAGQLFGDRCAVACLPWAPVSRIVASMNGGDRDDVNALAAAALITIARNLRQQAGADCPGLSCILLGHWSVSGWATPDGMSTDLFREPVLPVHELEQLGFDAVVLGHIHKGGIINEGAASPILYTGSPYPLNFGEAGCDHGVWLLDVEPGRCDCTFLPIESRRFVTIDIDAAEPEEYDALVCPADSPLVKRATFRDEINVKYEGAIVRLRYTATEEQARRIDNAALKRAVLAAGAHRCYVEATIVRQARARVEGLDETLTDTAALDAWLAAQGINGGRADTLRTRHQTYTEVKA